MRKVFDNGLILNPLFRLCNLICKKMLFNVKYYVTNNDITPFLKNKFIINVE